MPFRRNWLTCCAWWLLAAATVHAQPTVTLTTDIAPQPLYRALAAFADQTGLQVVYLSEVVGARKSPGALAGLSASAALDQLLDGTGLQFQFVNDWTVSIVAAASVQPAGYRFEAAGASDPVGATATLEEIIVTARRRDELASKVPISVVVWSREAMAASGVKGMDEIGALTPGVGFDWNTPWGAGAYTRVEIRGVTGRRGSTVGVFVDDTPLPPVWWDTFGRAFPSTFDLERVEVLRGPQGPLLGQGTLGGALRFIPTPPSLSSFSGLATAELATTAHGDLTYEAGAAVGGPVVTDVLGVRVGGLYRSEGGFVDRVDASTGTIVDGNANRTVTQIARAALTWAPTESVRITPSVSYQLFSPHDTAAFYSDLSNGGDLRNGSLVRTPFSDAYYLSSIKLTADLGSTELSAVSSLFDREAINTYDITSPSGDPLHYDYTDATWIEIDVAQRMFSQELRLISGDPDAAFTWLAGVFYSELESRTAHKIVYSVHPVDGQDATRIDQTQLEGYAQLSRRFGGLTASAALRFGRTRYAYVTEAAPIFRGSDEETTVTPRFDLSYETGQGDFYYLTAARGYRSGGIVPTLPGCGPAEFPSDTVWNYEVGTKRDLLDRRLHVDASIFHLRWDNGQQDAPESCFFGFTPGAAASSGFDLSAQARVTEHVSMGLAVTYTDTRYTQTIRRGDEVVVRTGDALGGVAPPWNVSASFEYEFPLTSDVSADIRAEDHFRGGNLGSSSPSTNLLNLRGTVRWPGVDLGLFVNNALDSRPTLNAFPSDAPSSAEVAYTFRPRTVGMSATWRF